MQYELIKFINDEWASMNRRHEFDVEPEPIPEHKGKWVPRIVEDEPNDFDELRETIARVTTITEDAVTVTHVVTLKTVDTVAAEKLGQISGKLDEMLETLVAGTSPIQRETWGLFSEQARLKGRKPTAPTLAIQERADIRNVDVNVVRDEILVESAVLEKGMGAAAGQSDLLQQAVDAAVTHSTMSDADKITAIIAVEWP